MGCYCIRLSSGPALERSVDKVDSTVSSRPKVCTRILRGERSDLRLSPIRGPYLGISAPLLETGEARLVLRGRGAGGG